MDSEQGIPVIRQSCELIGEIAKNTKKNWTTVCIFLDLSKAFNTLKHTAVFQKLERYGIRGNALEWFKSYLSSQKIRVKIDNTTSKRVSNQLWHPPKGPVLDP